MKIRSKRYGKELEIIKIKVNSDINITVESFKVSEGYKSFAYSSLPEHDALTGCGFHENQKESVKQAVRDLHQLMMK